MDKRDAQVVLDQMSNIVEQQHRLEVRLLDLWKTLFAVEPDETPRPAAAGWSPVPDNHGEGDLHRRGDREAARRKPGLHLCGRPARRNPLVAARSQSHGPRQRSQGDAFEREAVEVHGGSVPFARRFSYVSSLRQRLITVVSGTGAPIVQYTRPASSKYVMTFS